MKKIEQWMVDIFASHVLLVNPSLSVDDADNTVKISAMITLVLPFIGLFLCAVAFFSGTYSTESINVAVVVASIAVIFGGSSVTDRIYNRNKTEIHQRADQIKKNPKQGVGWVRRRLLRIYASNVAVIAVVVFLI